MCVINLQPKKPLFVNVLMRSPHFIFPKFINIPLIWMYTKGTSEFNYTHKFPISYKDIAIVCLAKYPKAMTLFS